MQRGPHPLLFQLRDNNGIYTDRLGEVGSGGERETQTTPLGPKTKDNQQNNHQSSASTALSPMAIDAYIRSFVQKEWKINP